MVPASREVLLHSASAAGLGGRRKAKVEGEIESHVALACCWSEFVATVHSFS